MNICVPYDKEYTDLLGLAVYSFEYYEGMIVDVISYYEPDFRTEYDRRKAMASSKLADKFETCKKYDQLEKYIEDFSSLVDRRNQLFHAHPVTHDGNQILNYQVNTDWEVCDFLWTKDELQSFLLTINRNIMSLSEFKSKLMK